MFEICRCCVDIINIKVIIVIKKQKLTPFEFEIFASINFDKKHPKRTNWIVIFRTGFFIAQRTHFRLRRKSQLIYGLAIPSLLFMNNSIFFDAFNTVCT